MSKSRHNKALEPLFLSNRDQVIKVLLDEITFLVQMYNTLERPALKRVFSEAIAKLERLLKIQGVEADTSISEQDCADLMRFILQTVQTVVESLEREGC